MARIALFSLVALALLATSIAQPVQAKPQDCSIVCSCSTPSWAVCSYGSLVINCGDYFDIEGMNCRVSGEPKAEPQDDTQAFLQRLAEQAQEQESSKPAHQTHLAR